MKRVDALRKLHEDVAVIDKEYQIERIKLEAAFKLKRDVVYEERKNIVTGAVDVEGNANEGMFYYYLYQLILHYIY